MSKFKVGDKVRIRKDLEDGQYYNYYRVSDIMAGMRGEEVVISHVLDKCYLLKNIIGYCWTHDMLEPIIENKYPRVMLVSKDGKKWQQRVVFMEKCNLFLAWINAKTFEEAESETSAYGWEYGKEPEEEEEEVVEMTMEDVCKALGKALGKTVKIIK